MKTHEEFLEEVKEATREPTIKELTEDALGEVRNKFGIRKK